MLYKFNNAHILNSRMTSFNNVAYKKLTDFYKTRHQQLQKYLFRQVRSQDVADELTQETYVRFLKQSENNEILDLNAFLFTIAANLVRDYYRNIKREQQREFVPLDPEFPDSKLGTEDILVKQALEVELQQAIASLPEKTKEIFLLYRVDGLSYKQISERLNISERTVEYHLRQAIILLRNYLTRTEHW